MAIKLDIALEQLAAPGVAETLARLVGALADPAMTAATPTSAGERAPMPVSAAPAAAPARKAPPKIVEEVPDAAERYRRFIAKLPERSRTFIDMVRTHKLLKISDAMRALGLTAPKAMGGLTGSIGRWAPNRGVAVPYETTTADGERAWRWIGSPIDKADAEPAAPKRTSETPTMLPAARPPVLSAPPAAAPPVDVSETAKAAGKAKAAKAPAAKAPAAKAPAAKAPADKAPAAKAPAAKAPAKAAAPTGRKPDLRDFEGLPEKSQEFLMLVASRGIVTREEALEALEYRRPKELGGATEPIIRRCREREIERPYVAGKRDGKRVWMWPTHPVPADVEVG